MSLVVIVSGRRRVVADHGYYSSVVWLWLKWNVHPSLVDLCFAAVLLLASNPENAVKR